MNNRIIIKLPLVIAFLVVVCIVVFFYFVIYVVPEFAYIKFTISDDETYLDTDPEDLLQGHGLSYFTDVHVEFINNSGVGCKGLVKYADNLHGFELINGSSYGWILPKGKQIEIGLCGQTRELDLTSL